MFFVPFQKRGEMLRDTIAEGLLSSSTTLKVEALRIELAL